MPHLGLQSLYHDKFSCQVGKCQIETNLMTTNPKGFSIMMGFLLRYKVIPATKVVPEAQGFNVGYPTFPRIGFTAEAKAEIIAEFKASGIRI